MIYVDPDCMCTIDLIDIDVNCMDTKGFAEIESFRDKQSGGKG